MRLLRIHIIAADTCGGLLDGLEVGLRSPGGEASTLDPLCLIGPNGSGKSQFLQVLAEIFQSVFHACVDTEERIEGNPDLQFELEYLIQPGGQTSDVHVRVSRQAEGKHKPTLAIHKKVEDEWANCSLADPTTLALLPSKVVGYTSGDNETLSLPFLVSRSGYAEEVTTRAVYEEGKNRPIPDTRLMLIDYGTHLEVLVANLLLGNSDQREALLQGANLDELHSFRCIVQLAHPAAPKKPGRRKAVTLRKGVQLTDELETHLENLRRCATCHSYEPKNEIYTFDFLVDEQTKSAFRFFWEYTLDLYSAFHKLAMLNDLAIPRTTRRRFKKDTKERRFASRLAEPQDEDKVFRFESVRFRAKKKDIPVDYVSLSDGEHQLAQLLGTFCMMSHPNTLFLLDEPESHFNPKWRVKFISRILDLPTTNQTRRNSSPASQQECILTTHAPFVPSDMSREQVFIFGKGPEEGRVTVRHPNIETYGTTFDSILEECFDVRPPISGESRKDIQRLMESTDPEEIRAGMEGLGHSVEKIFLADRLRQLTPKDGT